MNLLLNLRDDQEPHRSPRNVFRSGSVSEPIMCFLLLVRLEQHLGAFYGVLLTEALKKSRTLTAAVGAPKIASARGVFAAVVRPGVAAGPAAKTAPSRNRSSSGITA